MSWSRVGDPSELLQLGQTVEVLVTRVDPEARQIGLSLKKLGASPFDEYAKGIRPGRGSWARSRGSPTSGPSSS